MQKNIHLLNKISFGVVLSLICLLPVFFSPLSFISLQFGTSLLFAFTVIVVFLIYIATTLISGSIEVPKSKRLLVPFLATVPVVYFLSNLSNGFSRSSFFGYTFDVSSVGFICFAFLFAFLVSIYFRNNNRIFHSYLGFLLSSVVFAVFLTVRIVWGADFLSFGKLTELTTTVLGNWNNVAIFFGVGVILSLLTYQMLHISKVMKIILSIVLIISLFFLALVNFKTVWIIISLVSLLFILKDKFSKPRIFFYPVPLYPLIVFIISVIFAIGSFSIGSWKAEVGNYISQKLEVNSFEFSPSFGATFTIGKAAILAKPLLGSGPNTFVYWWQNFKPADVTKSIYWNVDFQNGSGLIPTLAITSGILGLLSWLIFLGLFIYLGVKSLSFKTEDVLAKYFVTSSFFVSLYLWIMNILYFPSAVIVILTFFFTGIFISSIYLAEIFRVEIKHFKLRTKAGVLTAFPLTVLFICFIYLSVQFYKNISSLRYYQMSSNALNTLKDENLSDKYMQEAVKLVPFDTYFRALSEIKLVKLNTILSADPKKEKLEDIQKKFKDTMAEAISSATLAKDADPKNYQNFVALGRVYETLASPNLKIDGSFASAKSAYETALKLNSTNPSIPVLLARLSAANGDLKQAKVYALESIKIKNNYLDAYFILTQIEVADKNLKGAIDSVTTATTINPNDPATFFQLGLLKYNIKDFDGAILALESATKLTPDYANARYFLGLSYDQKGLGQKALTEFEKIKLTNPDNAELDVIIANLKAGKPALFQAEEPKPEKGKKLPVKEVN